MNIESIRRYCLSLPHATEDLQWGDDLLFRVGGKIFTVVNLDLSSPNRLSFKCAPEDFAELIQREGVIPAPYVARYNWVAVQGLDILTRSEMRKLIRASYDMVAAKLPKKLKREWNLK